jgi:uncharacterized membrane protein YozB (DUF420 family)
MSLRDLPTLNALLNMTAAALLVWGYVLIRRKKMGSHRRVMLAACTVSAAFLVSYLIYHYQVGSVRFQKTGIVRTVYFGILLSHTLLAALVAPLAIMTLRRGLKADYTRHRRIARWTLPIWIYVSVTGVVVYVMLYRL